MSHGKDREHINCKASASRAFRLRHIEIHPNRYCWRASMNVSRRVECDGAGMSKPIFEK